MAVKLEPAAPDTYMCENCGTARAAIVVSLSGDDTWVELAYLCLDCLAAQLDVATGWKVARTFTQWRYQQAAGRAVKQAMRVVPSEEGSE